MIMVWWFLHNSLAFSMVIRRFYNKLAMIKLIFLSHVTSFSLIVTFVVSVTMFLKLKVLMAFRYLIYECLKYMLIITYIYMR